MPNNMCTRNVGSYYRKDLFLCLNEFRLISFIISYLPMGNLNW
jgi:hypothetical protein